MKKTLKKIVGQRGKNIYRACKRNLKLIECYMYDYKRYKCNYTDCETAGSENFSKDSLLSWLLQDKHRIEKGLALPKPRYDFGQEVISRLCKNIEMYQKRFGHDENVDFCLSAFKAYDLFHKNHDIKYAFSEHPLFVKAKTLNFIENKSAGIKPLPSSNDVNFDSVILTRKSIRNFNDKEIKLNVIEKIMNLTITTPSVCNRQHWRAHFFTGEKALQILELQNGNAGFRDNIPMLAVITSKLPYFVTPLERYQPFIDGGMFAMNFLNACHYNGVGSCALNWCASPTADKKIHNEGLIPHDENVIMLIALGYYDEGVLVACSPKRDKTNFYSVHENVI